MWGEDMTDAEIYEVIEGFKNGEQLECVVSNTDKWVSFKPFISELLRYLADDVSVRIKPVPKYRPFETVEEVEPHYGRVVQCDGDSGLLIGAAKCGNELEIYMNGHYFNPKGDSNIKFKDGTPFGVEVK